MAGVSGSQALQTPHLKGVDQIVAVYIVQSRYNY